MRTGNSDGVDGKLTDQCCRTVVLAKVVMGNCRLLRFANARFGVFAILKLQTTRVCIVISVQQKESESFAWRHTSSAPRDVNKLIVRLGAAPWPLGALDPPFPFEQRIHNEPQCKSLSDEQSGLQFSFVPFFFVFLSNAGMFGQFLCIEGRRSFVMDDQKCIVC